MQLGNSRGIEGEMIKLTPLAVAILASSCMTHLSEEDRLLLEADAENKRLELIFLEEIRVAQDNLDYDAYRYFLNEYFKVERLDIPPRLQTHPNYTKGGIKLKY